MEFLKEWITNIILFVLLATVIDMLLPNSSMQKYTKMVTGLLLITIILSPILKLISSDFETTIENITVTTPEEKNLENSIELQKKEIQASLDAYALEEVAVQLKGDVEEELMEQYGFEIASINLSVNEDSKEPFPANLQLVSVKLREPVEEDAIEVVQPIEINTDVPLASHGEETETSHITSLLSDKWEVNESAIEIFIERGNS